MKNNIRAIRASMIALILALSAVVGVLYTPLDSYAGQDVKAAVSAVPYQEVCMVTDRVFAKPQIPVEYEGKTYYGCCKGCVARIKADRSIRYAVDPVTGREVDKATAFITEGKDGEALYFESSESAAAYAPAGEAN